MVEYREDYEEFKLFQRWIGLKYDIQDLADIVQNPLDEYPIGEATYHEWLVNYDHFSDRLDKLQKDTLDLLRSKAL